MARLLDRLLMDRNLNPNLRSELLKSTLIVADNVADYWFENEGTNTALPHPNRLCLAPPFKTLFIESRFRSVIHSCAISCTPLNSDDHQNKFADLLAFARKSLETSYSTLYINYSNVYWLLPFDFFFLRTKHSEPERPPITLLYLLDKRGYSVIQDDRSFFLYMGRSALDITEPVAAFTPPLIATLAFLNCKNVELIDNPPPPALSRTHLKRTGEPLVTYKTLKVNPLRVLKHYQAENRPISTNVQSGPQRLTIYRGHFKDFRDGKGLFGKYKEIYWWEQHFRGAIENGAILKDYEVL